ncbi:MAG: methyltransferase domain-containing protein [Acidimicrobiia bacterium]|nr:methyltransferase domain-containing protein [Acidimicrobiia bacterium]
MTDAASVRWRRWLEEWAIPLELMEAVPDSPYGWSPELWKRRAQVAREQGSQTPTSDIIRSLLPASGTLLDVGAGTGRASLVHAAEGYSLTAVEKNPDLAEGFRQRATEQGVSAELVEGAWPDIAGSVDRHDVAMCAHVVYDVADIEPFLSALARHARVGVVVELTPGHPWSDLLPYYRALHRLERPHGPTYADFVEVVEEVCEASPHVETWTRPGQVWFESWDEILDHYGKRLVLPRSRWSELRELLVPETKDDAGRLYVGSRDRTIVTVWWHREE